MWLAGNPTTYPYILLYTKKRAWKIIELEEDELQASLEEDHGI